MLQLWRSVLPNGDTLKQRFFVCHLHFDENDVITEDVIKLADGTEFRSKRIRFRLKDDAVPKHFPHVEPIAETKIFEPPSFERIAVDKAFGEETEFSNIYKNVKKIPFPSSLWFATQKNDFLLFNKWIENLDCNSLSIFLHKNKEVNVSTSSSNTP